MQGLAAMVSRPCAICGRVVDVADNFCHGCRAVICEDHEAVSWVHAVHAHAPPPLFDGEPT